MKKGIILLFIMLAISISAKEKKTKIIFMGDSITDGNWGGGNADADHRNKDDYNHIYGHGFMEMITGYYMSNYPEEEYIFQNRGISGYRLDDLKKRWDKDVVEQRPDILSILVGTNDAGFHFRTHQNDSEFDYSKWDADYRELLDKALEANADTRIVICSPFIVKTGDAETVKIQELRKGMVEKLTKIVEKIASDYNAIYVPYDKLFEYLGKKYDVPDNYWSWDGIHPTTAGHTRMAKMWIKKVGKL